MRLSRVGVAFSVHRQWIADCADLVSSYTSLAIHIRIHVHQVVPIVSPSFCSVVHSTMHFTSVVEGIDLRNIASGFPSS